MYVFNELKLRTQQACRNIAAVIGWTIAGAALGTVSAGLFGILFAALVALMHGDTSRILGVQAYFVLCGGVAGALMGGFGRLFDVIGTPDLESSLHKDSLRGDMQDQVPPNMQGTIAHLLITVQIAPELPAREDLCNADRR